MAVSAVIRCHQDERILNCIDDLRGNQNPDHEIVAVLTETSEKLARILEGQQNVRLASAPFGNLSRSTNIGIGESKNDKIMVLDADLRCSKGALDRVDTLLDEHELVRAGIQFKWESLSEKMVAELRDYIYGLPDIFYCPGIAFKKSIKDAMGGHFFNENVWWTEDAEFNFRRSQAGLPFYRTPETLLTHEPEKMSHDLKGAYKIGRGKYAQVLFANRRTFEERLDNVLKRIASGKAAQTYLRLMKSRGGLVSLYSMLWDACYYAGYYREHLKELIP